MKSPIEVNTITEFHKLRKLPMPEHPLISVIECSKMKDFFNESEVYSFYSVTVQRGIIGKLKYGWQEADFDEGVIFFAAPNQVLQNRELSRLANCSGLIMLIHPDFIWNTPLAKTIKQYEFFDYAVDEALWLSEKEEATINCIIQNILREAHSNIDKFSKQIIISQIECLLNYAKRFYHRQFIIREKANRRILESLEKLLTNYFNSEELISGGLPTVQYIAQKLNISSSHLNSLLKVLTGQTTQQYIHEKLIENVQEKLSATNLTVKIAYELGFKHLQSFNKLFKENTNFFPLGNRASLN